MMIKSAGPRDGCAEVVNPSPTDTTALEVARPSEPSSDDVRLARVVRAAYPMIWRLARRFGLSHADADDVAQQAVVIVSRRLPEIVPGAERAFLCRATLFLASKVRRNRQRRAEETVMDWEEHESAGLDPEQLLEQRRACADLDTILDELPESLRAVFVLFELELQSQVEVAEALQIPQGTVASRLRKARNVVASAIARKRRKNQRIGTSR